MPDRTHDELARYWDALTTGTDPGPISPDPSLAEAIRRFEQSEDAPGADPTFVANLMEELVYAHALPDAGIRKPVRATDTPGLRSRPNVPPVTIPSMRMWPRWLPALVSAALLLVALAIAVRQFDWGRGDGQRPGGPAIFAPATPSLEADSTDETLVEIPLPADVLPAGEPVTVGMATVTMSAGTFQQYPDEARDNPGVLAIYLLDGSVTVVSDEAMQLIAAGGAGTGEEIPAGAEVVLMRGDTLVTRKSPGEAWTNEGPEDVRLLALEVHGGPAHSSFFPAGWTIIGNDYTSELAMPDGPTLLRLRRLTAPPETVLAPPAAALAMFAQLEGFETGSNIARRRDGSVRFIGDEEPVTAFILTFEVADDGVSTPTVETSPRSGPAS